MVKYLSVAIKNRYGSKKGMLRYYKYKLLLCLGLYKKYQKIDLTKIERLVFVCSGNICRSPLAEVQAKKMGFKAVSYGLHCAGGAPADPRAIEFAHKNNLDLTGHESVNIKDYQFSEGDLVVGMEPAHIKPIEAQGIPKECVAVLGWWLKPKRLYIHDPYNTEPYFFEYCESLVVSAVEAMIESR